MGHHDVSFWRQWQPRQASQRRHPLRWARRWRLRKQSRKQTAVLTLAGVFLVLITAPKVLPLWCLKSTLAALCSQLLALKLDTEMIASLALAGGYLRDAQQQVADEQESVTTERDAFVTFADQVQTIPAGKGRIQGAMTAQVANTGAGGQQLETVRRRYQETVMSVPDYDCTYAESFDEHFTAEFGPDVAAIVTGGQQFNEPIKQLLIQQARQSAHSREQLLHGLAVEGRSLQRSRSELDPVRESLDRIADTSFDSCRFDDLISADATLREQRDRCESILQTRQQDIHSANRRVGGITETFLHEYLYSNLPTRFPVLSTTLNYLAESTHQRSALISSLCRRV